MDLIEKMKTEMLRRKYSIRTITTYFGVVNAFLKYLTKNKKYSDDLRKIRKSDVKEYLNTLHEKAGSTINVHLNALKFMMEEILHKHCYVHIHFSKTPKHVAEYLTKEETLNLINAIDNEKHKLMIKLLYSAGMRVSELVNLKVENLNFNESSGWIRHGKGNKDRVFIIADAIKDELAHHVNFLTQHDFVFSGRNGHYSQRSIQEIIKNATKKAKIRKNIHPHTLRHSFTNHMFKNETNPLAVQSLLGHSDIKTTMHYAHIEMPKLTGVKSPLDI